MNQSGVRKCAPLAGAVGLVVLGLTLPARGANLLINPSFEAPTDSSGTNNDYTVAGWHLLDDTERAQFDHPPDGLWALWFKTFELDGVNGADALADGSIPGGGGATQTVNVQAGGTYALTAQEFYEAGAPASGATISMGFIWLNSSNAVVGTKVEKDVAPNQETTGSWQTVFTAGVAPATASQAQVFFTWAGGSVVAGQSQSVLIDLADFDGPGTAPTNSEWALNGSGDWNAGGNWTNGTVPNQPDAEADFFSVITANHNVFTDIAVTAGILNFNNAKTYVIDGAGSLTLQTSTGNANVIVQQGVQEINVPLTIASNTIFNVSPGATLVIGNPLTVNAGKSVTTTGTGTVTYNSIITLQTGATLMFANSTHAAALNLVGTSAATLASHTGATQSILQLDALSVGGTLNHWTSKVDLTNNAMIVHNGNLANITNQLKAGFNAGAGYWNGSAGIVSAAAASDTRHLTTLGSRQSNGSAFNGVATSTTDVLVKYTYYGDATLDGKVDGADYQQIDMGFGTNATGWQNGDFNYDGVINGSDFALIDNTFNQITATNAASLAATGADPIATPADLSVPEPASLGIIGFAAMGLLNKRRRRVD